MATIHEQLTESLRKAWVDPITSQEIGLPAYPRYSVDVSSYKWIDIYRILMLFKVTDPPLQHAIKKLLVAGNRAGGKDKIQDIQESIDALKRMLEILREDQE